MARPLLLLLALCLAAAVSQAFLVPTPSHQPQHQRRLWQQQPQQVQELRWREALPLVSRPEQRPSTLATQGTRALDLSLLCFQSMAGIADRSKVSFKFRRRLTPPSSTGIP